MAREKIDNKLNVVIGTKAQVEADNTIPENSIIVVTDEELAPSNAQKNVQSDWDQATDTEDDYIKNKPTIPTIPDLTLNDNTETSGKYISKIEVDETDKHKLNVTKAILPQGFSGNYNDLTNRPTLFSGDYDDLSNKPTIPTIPTISTTITSGAKTISGENNTEYRFTYSSGVSSLTFSSISTPTTEYCFSVIFISGSTATTITNTLGVYWLGQDVSSGVFTPIANKQYQLSIWYNGLSWYGSVIRLN